MASSPTTSIVTAENVVIPPQNPGSKNHRRGVIPRRSINTKKKAAKKAAPKKTAKKKAKKEAAETSDEEVSV